MTDLDGLKSIIKQSSELSKLGQDEKALTLLDDSLIAATQENRTMWIRILAQHAAVISDSIGDVRRVRRYYEQSLAANPDNARALYGLAKALQREGDAERAKEYAVRCYHVLQQGRGSELDRALLELVVAGWPELGQKD
jgi:tetratricopeptide (TPR) repeat protein